jgi:hypothetical protein
MRFNLIFLIINMPLASVMDSSLLYVIWKLHSQILRVWVSAFMGMKEMGGAKKSFGIEDSGSTFFNYIYYVLPRSNRFYIYKFKTIRKV